MSDAPETGTRETDARETGVRESRDGLVLHLTDERDAADLRAYLARLLRYDRHAVARLRADGAVLGVFTRPPFGVLALRTVRLAEPFRFDLTVSAGHLRDRLEPVQTTPVQTTPVADLPEPVTGPAWTGQLPPRSGWQPLGSSLAGVLSRAVGEGVAEFRRRIEAVPRTERTRTRLDRVAEEVWARPVLAEIPLRAAHAASALGFLTGDGTRDGTGDDEVTTHRAGSWLRLDAPRGTVAFRPGRGPSLPLYSL